MSPAKDDSHRRTFRGMYRLSPEEEELARSAAAAQAIDLATYTRRAVLLQAQRDLTADNQDANQSG